jgi:hypothetical protein
MTKIEPELDPAVRVPGGIRTSRYVALALALVVVLALIAGLFPSVQTVPGPTPPSPPPAPAVP